MYLGDTSTSSYGYPWERSRYYNNSNYVCRVRSNGSANSNIYSDSFGLAPAFVIGN
nr:MAG TPA: LsbB, antimicrobial peptide, receptor binding [Caudoviricetes sp.]